MSGAHRNDNSIANSQNEDSDFQQLNNHIDSIYNTYSSNNHDSVESLDSEKNRYVFKYGDTSNNQLPSVHISSRLSSMEPSNSEGVAKSAPGTPSSIGSFDFRPRYPRAVTNSSLNVLLDTASGNSQFKSIVDSPARRGSNEDANTLDDGVPQSSEYNAGDRNWQEEGAALKTIQKPNGEVSTIRRSVTDFKFGKELGEGSYSTVILATDKITNKNYAVKVLDKRHIIKEKKVKYVNIEKHALNRLSNRMGVISLYFTFQDKDSLYFVLDYASNGELLSLIKKYNTLNEDCTRHFGAQILDAIKYMHDNGVIHRDIKPENILLDDKMRIQITDFGTARLLEKKNDESEDYPLDVRAKSFVGTAEYVSPELLESKFCGKPGDIWAFGCIIYQMIAGKPPFKATNEYLTFQKITKLQYAFSAGFPTIIRDLIKKILVLQPSKRATIPEIQKHFFFKDVDFNDYNQIWLTEPPELGPYKMTAKSMMKIPDIIKHSTSTVIPKKKHNKALTSSGDENSVVLKPRNGGAPNANVSARKPSNAEVTGNVNPANAAAYALHKPLTVSDSSIPESNSNSKDNSNDSKRSSRGSQSQQPDYIPGTNILRPQINTRPSLHSYKSSREKPKPAAKSKPNVLAVRPPGTLEEAWGAYLTHPDERVLRIGSVYVHRESTEAFEKKHKGSLHASPLDAGNTNRNRSGTSLLSQMVNGVPAQTHFDSVDEKVAIQEPYEEQLLNRSNSKKSSKKSSELERTQSTTSNRLSKRSFFKKLGLSQSDKKDDTDDEPVNIFSLDKPQVGTMVVTTHGRALVFARRDLSSDYEIILTIELKYPFIRFQELVSVSTRFSKVLPSVGVFTITSTESTYVFEVEKFEVTQWTEALSKARTNELERGKLEQEDSNSPGNSKESITRSNVESPATIVTKDRHHSSPKLADSPVVASTTTPQPRVSSEKGARRSPPDTAKSNIRETPKSSHMLKTKMQRSTPKRKPPPVSPPNEVNTTGLPKDSSDSGFLRAAKLAVAHNAHIPVSNNRRSSFTKEDGRKVDPNKTRAVSRGQGSTSSSNPSSPVVTSSNSKFLARSIRK
ncbi:PKH1 [Candida theae]|uniref:non-specific serine/threonine protein kinase n=1 Tax=Candida theae TaxID=1198502 RepID=A0AAD5BIB1_9ASCO|nr:PKH1 [Candida theae]KAI5964025.1 PKH1 [Candida theae]